MKNKNVIELKIEKMVFGGKSIGKSKDKQVILSAGIEGQKVRAKITKKKKGKEEGKIVGILEKSPIETESTCSVYGECGGCSMLSVAYDKQLELKTKMLRELFLSKGHTEFENISVLSSPKPYEYKNKMEFSFGDETFGGEMTLGLHKKGSYMSVVNTLDCKIVDKDYRTILKNTLDFFTKKEIPFYNSKTHKGYLRNLVIRKGQNTSEIQVNLVTSSQMNFPVSEFAEMINNLSLDGKVSGILHTTNDNVADTITPENLEIIYGSEFFYDEVLGKKFKISPFSFFQTSTKGAEKLYSTAIKMLDRDYDTIFDLYSGTGTIAISLAGKAKKIYAIEIVEEAVEMAKKNAGINGLYGNYNNDIDNEDKSKSLLMNNGENVSPTQKGVGEQFIASLSKEQIPDKSQFVEFISGDVGEKLPELSSNPELIILDPPRSGITPKTLGKIISFNAQEILYISCNPKMLAEDLITLKEAGYKVLKTTAVDMFPNTNHVETVVLMSRK